ncbi:hypothetical protein [Rhizobium sp. CECT 9324]|uniref:hypothetical protein n=1 Tax=Rhizobium sp. CECT 9324 TaxID=2845820 RepID=UPI001E5CD66E|nr:hypothetical protein [Rhizobium sp. CECT 9324]CAH0340907.1 hypothetical protein RHI9324_02589 [Rhizobium sp. CECT 9324]
MTGFNLGPRARLSIELALAATSGDDHMMRPLEKDARTLGMTGAEIDMARSGSSFDFQVSKAIALALAPNSERRTCAMAAGIDAQVCAEIEAIAASHMTRSGLTSA